MSDAEFRALFARIDPPVEPEFVEQLLAEIDHVLGPPGRADAGRAEGERAYLSEPPDHQMVAIARPRAPRRRAIAVLVAVAAVIVVTVAVTRPGAHPRPNPVAPAHLPSSASAVPGGSRTSASPLVDLNARLHQLSQQEVFTVQTDHPTYFRVTALSTFSGSGWSLDDTYRPVDSGLPADTAAGALPSDPGPFTTVTATFHISALQSLWLPVPYRPVRVSGVAGLSWSAGAASVITDKPTSDGLTYTVTSQVPDVTPAQLRDSPRVDRNDPALGKYLALPGNIDPRIRALAAQIVSGAPTPYDEALAIENYLRGPLFRYSLNVPADQSQSALVEFLFKTRAGFSQQFASAFAVLAREVGLPSRVAVGFTEGTVDGQGYYHVTDADAHAWPEVWFSGVGWIAFEPTPAQPATGLPTTPAPLPAATVTITPNTGLGDPQVVHVVGKGLVPGVTYTATECANESAAIPSVDCAASGQQGTASAIADATGTVSMYVLVSINIQSLSQFGPPPSAPPAGVYSYPATVDCATSGGCVIRVSSGNQHATGTISFAP
jgi:transglutaminase-like putative cysteine protease